MSIEAQAPAVSAPTTSAPAAPAAATPTDSAQQKGQVPLDAPTPKEGEAAAPKIEVDQGVSRHFAELERRKAAFKAEQEKVLAERKAAEPVLKELEAFKAAKAEAKKDPFKAFAMLGLDNDDIANALMQAPSKPSDTDVLKNELAELRKQIQAEKEAKAKAEQAANDARNMDATRQLITKTLQAPEFELTRAHGDEGRELVFDVMTAHWVDTKKKTGTGQVLPFAVACKHVEAMYEKIAATAAATEKWKAKQQSAAAPAQDTKAPTKATEQPAKPVTITNKTTADTPPGEAPLDDAAKRANAISNLRDRMAKRRAAQTQNGASKQ